MRIRAIAPIVVAAITLVACAEAGPPAAGPGDTGGASTAATGSAAPTVLQAAPSGATLEVDTGTGTASYTVGNWRAVPLDAQIIPGKGVMYSMDVRIVANTGTVAFNGFYFAARTADGSTVAPAVGAVRPGITSGQLSPGQSVDGHVAFDFAPGTAVTGVVLRDPAGKQVAFWSVS